MFGIHRIPTEELQADLEEAQADIALCEQALSQDVTTYGDSEEVLERLLGNILVAKRITDELIRRIAILN